MLGICMHMLGTCKEGTCLIHLAYAWNMLGICMNMLGMCKESAWNVHGMSIEHAWNMHEYAWNVQEICLEYTRNKYRIRRPFGSRRVRTFAWEGFTPPPYPLPMTPLPAQWQKTRENVYVLVRLCVSYRREGGLRIQPCVYS